MEMSGHVWASPDIVIGYWLLVIRALRPWRVQKESQGRSALITNN